MSESERISVALALTKSDQTKNAERLRAIAQIIVKYGEVTGVVQARAIEDLQRIADELDASAA